jgi:hypothetical protein
MIIHKVERGQRLEGGIPLEMIQVARTGVPMEKNNNVS